jgi:hypothetical protein
LLAFSSSSFAGGAISFQWGNDPKPGCDDCDSKYKKKEALHHMLQHMGTAQNINTDIIPTATYIMTQVEICIFT